MSETKRKPDIEPASASRVSALKAELEKTVASGRQAQDFAKKMHEKSIYLRGQIDALTQGEEPNGNTTSDRDDSGTE